MRSFFILMFSYAVVMYMVEIIPVLQLEEFVETGRGSRSLIGAAVLCSTMTEILIFNYGYYFTKNFSPQLLLSIAHFCCIVRLLGYILVDLMECPELILPFQLLNGGTFALFWLTTMEYSHDKCPANMCGSVQGCIGTLMTVAQACSSLIWGQVYESWGPQVTYAVGIVCLFLSLGLVTYTFCEKRQPFYEGLSQTEPRSVSSSPSMHTLHEGDQSEPEEKDLCELKEDDLTNLYPYGDKSTLTKYPVGSLSDITKIE